ncbi:conserved protein of unknown function [Microbacterium sp. Nx66]|nr:conserved protein of unknown function [Microbacterium sp. Nx66]
MGERARAERPDRARRRDEGGGVEQRERGRGRPRVRASVRAGGPTLALRPDQSARRQGRALGVHPRAERLRPRPDRTHHRTGRALRAGIPRPDPRPPRGAGILPRGDQPGRDRRRHLRRRLRHASGPAPPRPLPHPVADADARRVPRVGLDAARPRGQRHGGMARGTHRAPRRRHARGTRRPVRLTRPFPPLAARSRMGACATRSRPPCSPKPSRPFPTPTRRRAACSTSRSGTGSAGSSPGTARRSRSGPAARSP